MDVSVTVAKNPRIEQLLKKAGFDIQQFSREADLTYSTAHAIAVSGFTNGTRLGTIRKCAKALGITIVDLLTFFDGD